MNLYDVRSGDYMQIKRIPDDTVRVQAIRMGLVEGSVARCTQKVLNGSVVIACGKQEIAIGARLAKEISVDLIEEMQWEGTGNCRVIA